MKSDVEIRRMHISDEQWLRTSASWKFLKPARDFNQMRDSDESITDYCKRVSPVIDVPPPVAEQWLYYHYYNSHTVDNYGWIDYKNAVFELSVLKSMDIVNLNVIDAYRNYVLEKQELDASDRFSCTADDLQFWIKEGSWRVPPIVMDVQSFPPAPEHADINKPYQLVEGHTRLGYFLSLKRAGVRLKHAHQVYILRCKNMNNCKIRFCV